ncbi:MAG: hypothetical protein Q3971_06475 [Moraxella sp.]|nr:hypothetical protein [Moraxella sp.]
MNDFCANIDGRFGQGFAQKVQTLIATYRQTQDLGIFKEFAFVVHDHTEFGKQDKHFYQRQILMLLLSYDVNRSDKALIRWLIVEFCKNIKADFWVDLRSVMALLGFMLYEMMDNEDLPYLYMTKFGACSDSFYSVDTEIVMGFGEQETLTYLKNKQGRKHKILAKTLKAYRKNGAELRSHDEYCKFFREHRFAMRQKEIATDCGLIDDDELF